MPAHVSVEQQQIDTMRAAAQLLSRQPAAVPEGLRLTIARTLYAVLIEVNSDRDTSIELRRAAFAMAREVVAASEPGHDKTAPPSPA